MSVHVDKLRCYPSLRRRGLGGGRGKSACHLTADTEEELRAMAVKLRLHPEWIQRARILHYDLTASMRKRAVRAGAIEITSRRELRRKEAT